MTVLSKFYGPAGKPARVTPLLSGSGTFTPLAAAVWVRLSGCGGGAGGLAGAAALATPRGGGGAAASIQGFWLRLTAAVAYAIAADAAAGVDGNYTLFGSILIPGGKVGVTGTGGYGGGYDPAVPGIVVMDSFVPGGAGGGTGTGKTAGRAPLFCYPPNSGTVPMGGGAAGADASGYLGGCGGGSTPWGTGGVGGAANAAGTGSAGGVGTGPGAGGGSGGSGSAAGGGGAIGKGGVLYVEEWIE